MRLHCAVSRTALLTTGLGLRGLNEPLHSNYEHPKEQKQAASGPSRPARKGTEGFLPHAASAATVMAFKSLSSWRFHLKRLYWRKSELTVIHISCVTNVYAHTYKHEHGLRTLSSKRLIWAMTFHLRVEKTAGSNFGYASTSWKLFVIVLSLHVNSENPLNGHGILLQIP